MPPSYMLAHVNRREFLQSVGAGAALVACGGAQKPPAAAQPADWIVEATIEELGKRSSREVTEAYLARIRAIDPILHAVIELNPDALAIADAMDAERKAGNVRGPLHGIPVL